MLNHTPTLAFLNGTAALGIVFALLFIVAVIGLTTSYVRRNNALFATGLVIVAVGLCGSGIAAAMWFMLYGK
jgi:uncharacterized membrane protein (DUF485 family)